jgi:hypothetical protein
VTEFISGLLVMGYAAVALCFGRFWRRSRDRLFLFFAAAFAILTIQRTLIGTMYHGEFAETWLYLMRLGAYLLIVAGIVDKNRR